jgi:hypothetical protein
MSKNQQLYYTVYRRHQLLELSKNAYIYFVYFDKRTFQFLYEIHQYEKWRNAVE